MLNLHHRKPHRRLVLETLREQRRPMTTAELGAELKVDLRRLGEVVGLMVQEHLLEPGPRRADGFAWLMTEVGRRELARMVAAERGERFAGLEDEDEPILQANLRRLGA